VPLEVGLWRVDGGKPVRLTPSGVPLESQLEDMIEADPTILGTPLMLIGRQVPTDYGKFIDLLAVDDEGALHVLELKRERTPREVIAQVLDYGSWIQGLDHEQILDIFSQFRPHLAFEQSWTATFGGNPPEDLGGTHHLTVVASDVDPATERIIGYLAGFEVPVNVVFFRYFSDGDRSYLARTWLLDEIQPSSKKGKPGGSGSKEPWNERDWYVNLGEEGGTRNWDDARKYGFVSAGGGEWFSRTLRNLPVGARVFVCIPGLGYVGVGETTGPAVPFDDATVEVDGQEKRLADLPLSASYRHTPTDTEPDPTEYVVPVKWTRSRSRQEPVWEKGMFANQNSACKLRNRFTLERLALAFDLDDE
jgi:hypothetical protein